MKVIFILLLQATAFVSVHAQTAPATSPAAAEDSILVKVEVESYFPGGANAWIRFLNNNLTYPNKAVRKKIEGTVIVQFIVEKDGTLSNVEAISGPALLQSAAVEVFKYSPPWKPALQNGRIVKSYKKQPITFKLHP
jgi:protein TonB